MSKRKRKKEENGFEITQERIDLMFKGAEYIRTIGDFAKWCDDNFYGNNVIQCYYIFEDVVKSNKHIILKINKLMPPPPSTPPSK